ncbi:hypothetical protein IJV79_03705, partial [bacterium]|nr:hypothetical protein [bacterium]
MGLAASQCRLLSINSRLANLELRSQQLSNQKVALSTASTNASNKYIRALNNEYINIYDENGNYQQATANLLTNYGAQTAGDQLFLQNDLGQILCSNSVLDAFNLSNGNLEAFLRAAGGCTSTGNTSVLSSVAGTTAMELDAIANMAKQLKVNDELLAPDTGLAANFSNIQNAVSSVYKQGNDVYNLEQYH